MKLELDHAPVFRVSMSLDDLQVLAQNPERGVAEIMKQAERALAQEPRFAAQTKATALFSRKQECPLCHLLFEARGLSVHIRRGHHRKPMPALRTRKLLSGVVKVVDHA